MRQSFRRLFVTAAALAVAAIPAGAAHASCELPLPVGQAIAQSEYVFVGTVTGLAWQDRVATVEVHEVWKGDVGARVTVNGGSAISLLEEAQADGLDVWTSVDRTYLAGERYLFVSYAVDEGAFLDNQCSATQAFTSDLDSFRPADARVIEPPTGGGPGPALWLGLGGGLLALAGGGWLLRRRRPAQPAAV